MLSHQLSLELLGIVSDSASVQRHVVRVDPVFPFELLLESRLRSVHDGSLDRVRVLHYSEVVLRSNIRRVKQMLDHAVHVLLVLILRRVLLTDECTLLASKLTSLSLRASLLLITEEALKIIAQLRVDIRLVLFSLLRANEREEAVHLLIVLFNEHTLLFVAFLENLVLIFEILLQALLVELLTFAFDFVELRQLIKEILLLLLLVIMGGTIILHFLADLIQVLLHELLARQLRTVIDLLAELNEICRRLTLVIVLLIADLVDSLETNIAGLRVGIAHIERGHRVAQFIASAIRHHLRVGPRLDIARRAHRHLIIVVSHERANT